MSVPIFILVPQVTMRKRLDVAGASLRWRDRLTVTLEYLVSDPLTP